MVTQTRIPAIPTKYQGRWFRSRLEVEWAQLFDRWGVVWEYEPEGFNLGGLWYLPDFLLPELRTVVEVKGLMGEEDAEKLVAFAKAAIPLGWLVIQARAEERWGAVVPYAEEPLPVDFRGLSDCPDCGAVQFFVAWCRVCNGPLPRARA